MTQKCMQDGIYAVSLKSSRNDLLARALGIGGLGGLRHGEARD